MVNRSKAYIAPLVLKDIPELEFRLVKNTYIFSDFRSLEPTVYLELWSGDESISEDYIQELYNFAPVEDIFRIEEDYLLVLRLDPRFNYEYLCFKKGNYSWYTPEAKIRIIEYLIDNVHRRSLAMVDKIRSVFNRDPMLKNYYERALDVNLMQDAELGSKMVIEEETFTSTSYKNFERILRTSEKII